MLCCPQKALRSWRVITIRRANPSPLSLLIWSSRVCPCATDRSKIPETCNTCARYGRNSKNIANTDNMIITKKPQIGALFLYRKGLLEYLAKCFFSNGTRVACVKVHASACVTLWKRIVKFSSEKRIHFLYHFSVA